MHYWEHRRTVDRWLGIQLPEKYNFDSSSDVFLVFFKELYPYSSTVLLCFWHDVRWHRSFKFTGKRVNIRIWVFSIELIVD
jgi:hypothetical protein